MDELEMSEVEERKKCIPRQYNIKVKKFAGVGFKFDGVLLHSF